MQRIHESGGWVENCRVNGSLALSRALGDFKFKQNKKLQAERQIVTGTFGFVYDVFSFANEKKMNVELSFVAYPDVEIHDIDESWDFVLLASDGIWDVLTNGEVVKMCLKKMERGLPPEEICEEIMTECLSPDLLMTGTDNMTIVLICFLHNKTYEDFCKRAGEYCKRLFSDDDKTSARSIAKYSPQRCANQENPDDDYDFESGDEEDMHADGEQNGIEEKKANDSNGIAENGVTENCGKGGDAETVQDIFQESKKFKEIDDETEPK